jgi:hypothetical protein
VREHPSLTSAGGDDDNRRLHILRSTLSDTPSNGTRPQKIFTHLTVIGGVAELTGTGDTEWNGSANDDIPTAGLSSPPSPLV